MAIIVSILDTSGTPVATTFGARDFECSAKLSEISTASFALDHDDPIARYACLREWTSCRVSVLADSNERTIFEGIVRAVSATVPEIRVELADRLFTLKSRLLFEDREYEGSTVPALLAGLFAEAETRAPLGISLSCNISATTTRTYRAGQTLFDVLRDLAADGYEFALRNRTLVFAETVGEDLTSGPGAVEFRYDLAVARERTIDSATVSYDADNIANAVLALGAGSSASAEDVVSIGEFGRVEKSVSAGGAPAAVAAAYLAERKESVREIAIVPIVSDFFIAEVGDTVSVSLSGGSDLLAYQGGAKVVEKSYRDGDLPAVSLKLSRSRARSRTFVEKIADMRDRIRAVELRTA